MTRMMEAAPPLQRRDPLAKMLVRAPSSAEGIMYLPMMLFPPCDQLCLLDLLSRDTRYFFACFSR